MSEKQSGAFLNLIRKAVGLPTGNASCCGTPAAESTPAKEGCCGTASVKEQKSSSCCNQG